MSQTNVFPAEGPYEPSFGEAVRRLVPAPAREAAQLTEASEADENAAPREDGGLPEERYLDREESWLRFNERVLELAEDESDPAARAGPVPGHLRDQPGRVLHGPGGRPGAPDGGWLPGRGRRGPAARPGAGEHPGAGRRADRHGTPGRFSERVNPELAEHGIEILRWKELSGRPNADGLSELFRQRIYPVLTPLVVDPAHPFPFISGLSLNLAVMIADPRTGRDRVRPGQGAAAAAAGSWPWRRTGSCRSRTSSRRT